MDPRKRKRIERRHREWLENDPLNRRLRDRIAHHERVLADERARVTRRAARPLLLRWLAIR